MNRKHPPSALTLDLDIAAPVTSPRSAITMLANVADRLQAVAPRYALFPRTYKAALEAATLDLERGDYADSRTSSLWFAAFANHYRLALHAWFEGRRDHVATPWRVAFETAEAGGHAHWIDLLLGINAHINHDLPFAVLDAAIDTHSPRAYEDFVAVNQALLAVTPDIRREMTTGIWRALSPMTLCVGPLLDRKAFDSLRRSRDLAWHHAHELTLSGAHHRDQLRCQIVGLAERTAYRIRGRSGNVLAALDSLVPRSEHHPPETTLPVGVAIGH